MLPIETDIKTIERQAIINERENFRFRAFLKSKFDSKIVDKAVHRLHREITSKIDCRECGNCCYSLTPTVTDSEIETLANLENISPEMYEELYLDEDKFDNVKYLKSAPCRYLDGKLCSIYPNRPAECRSYPHTQKKRFMARTLFMNTNYGICPIVYNIIENLKFELKFLG